MRLREVLKDLIGFLFEGLNTDEED